MIEYDNLVSSLVEAVERLDQARKETSDLLDQVEILPVEMYEELIDLQKRWQSILLEMESHYPFGGNPE